MEKKFINTDFEIGMCFLVDVVAECIEKEIFGFINKKNEHFSVQFCYVGLKNKVVKRKAEEDLCGVTKKVSKLSVSLENLLLGSIRDGLMAKDDKDLVISTDVSKRIKVEAESKLPGGSCVRKRTDVVVDVIQDEKRIKAEAESNLSGGSGGRKRTAAFVDVIQNGKPQPKKIRKKNI